MFNINVTKRDIKSKKVYSRVNSKAKTQRRNTKSSTGNVHACGASDKQVCTSLKHLFPRFVQNLVRKSNKVYMRFDRNGTTQWSKTESDIFFFKQKTAYEIHR